MVIESIDDIKTLLSQCEKKHGVISLKDISSLTLSGCVVMLGIDDNGDYFYHIPVESMLDKDIENDTITNNEWMLSPNEDEIIMYLI